MNYLPLERQILGELWTSNDLWQNLLYLCDRCNGRFAGTADERLAGDYLMARFQEYGLVNIHAETFEFRGWERGPASLVVNDHDRLLDLPCIALPGSQSCDLQAEIIDARQATPADFEKIDAHQKIVLTSADGPNRQEKYLNAFNAGAAAFIFTGSQPGMLSPTGSVGKELPAIGLSVESAARLRRLLSAGPVKAKLAVESSVKTMIGRNIIAELPGKDPTQGWILAGGHYDGHDIAQGAHDNATAITALLESARLLSPYQDQLQAGLRYVCFSGEELGLFGSHAYAHDHQNELKDLRLVFNADVLALAMPVVLQIQASPELAEYLRSLPLEELDAVVNDGPKSFIQNSDHFPFSLAGNSAVWALTSHPSQPAPWGHTSADTVDKVDLRILRQTTATLTRLLLRMACEPANLPRGLRTPEIVKKYLIDAGFEKSLRQNGKWPFGDETNTP